MIPNSQIWRLFLSSMHICVCGYVLVSINGHIGKQIVNLNSLVLTNNKISDFSEIDNLATCKKLEHLALVDNPVIHKLYYRLYTIYKIPSLRFLDFQKVKKSEREAATTFFESEVRFFIIFYLFSNFSIWC